MQDEGSDPFLTAHAERCGVQRNIPDALQEMVLKHADWRTYRPGGLKVALITRRKLERMADKVALDLRERLEGVHVLGLHPVSRTPG